LAVRNFGSQFTEDEWQTIESDLAASEIIFVIHVMDGENAGRLLPLLESLSIQNDGNRYQLHA